MNRTRFNLFLLFEFAEGGLLFGAVQKPLDIGPVHEDGQKADQHANHRNHRLIPMKHRKADAEGCSAQNGAEGHIAGEIQADGKDRQDNQGTAPISAQRNWLTVATEMPPRSAIRPEPPADPSIPSVDTPT